MPKVLEKPIISGSVSLLEKCFKQK